jgi:hypothetical protein
MEQIIDCYLCQLMSALQLKKIFPFEEVEPCSSICI